MYTIGALGLGMGALYGVVCGFACVAVHVWRRGTLNGGVGSYGMETGKARRVEEQDEVGF